MIRVILSLKQAQHINMQKVREKIKILSVNQMSVYHTILEAYNITKKNLLNSFIWNVCMEENILREVQQKIIWKYQKSVKVSFILDQKHSLCYQRISKKLRQQMFSKPCLKNGFGKTSTDTVRSRFKKAWFKKESRFKKDCSYNRFFST